MTLYMKFTFISCMLEVLHLLIYVCYIRISEIVFTPIFNTLAIIKGTHFYSLSQGHWLRLRLITNSSINKSLIIFTYRS
jgi:hypothetical protein